LISLQKGYGVEQLGKVADWGVLNFGKRLDEKGAFLDTAAILKHLDLLVTSDSAVAHLAGALGVQVWLVLGKAPDWRWQLGREDSPWYPTMRLFRQRKHGEWRDVFERLARELTMRPPLANAAMHEETGTALSKEGKHAEAANAFRRALQLDPKNPGFHNRLGLALEADGKKTEAMDALREGLRTNPDDSDLLHNLGNMLRRLNRLAEAEDVYRQALKVVPNSPEVCNHLGIALLGQAKHGEAEACFRRSLRLRPDHAEAHNNLGVLLEQLGHVEQATKCYQESLRIKPESVDTHKNLALGWLMTGDYGRGWAEYEWRWKHPANPARTFSQPRWDGRMLQGEAVLLYAEQGLGDTIQFVRYAPLVKQRGAVVLVECPGALQGILSRCPGIDCLIPAGSPLPEFAYQVPLLSLPNIMHTTLETVPAAVPYLSADPSLVDAWGKELNALPGCKVGIAWQGSKKYQGDAHRSIALREFEPLLKLPDLCFISLQKGLGTEQLVESAVRWNIVDFGQRLDAAGAFADTAAIMSNLDLIVTSDSAVAHLAGALGVRVWMALSMAADWRWLRKGNECAWYPSMRLYRQTEWGDWAGVFGRMAADVEQCALPMRKPVVVEIAPGELIDKIANLEIKREQAEDEQEMHAVRLELGALLTAKARSVKSSAELDALSAEIKSVNRRLREAERQMCQCEQSKDFGERFVELARSVCRMRDERAGLKRQINHLLRYRHAANHEAAR
jgi:Flp pilus assembly protein TadD